MRGKEIRRGEIPPIYVSSPGFDDMGSILDRLQIEYNPTSSVDVSQLDDAIVMINCQTAWMAGALIPSYRALSKNFETFIKQGGSGIVSDLACATIKSMGAKFEPDDWSSNVDAYVDHEELANLLGRRSIILDLSSAVRRPTKVPPNSTVFIRESETNDPLAYRFQYGEGDVVYTTFHNHEQTSEIEDALFKLLLMVPIASSVDASVTDAYKSLLTTNDDIPSNSVNKTYRSNRADNDELTSDQSLDSTDLPPSKLGSDSNENSMGSTSEITCPKCGQKNDSDSSFCERSSCGFRLEH